MAAMAVMTTIVAMTVMAFGVAAIVAMAGSHGSHVKETCSLLLEAMAAPAQVPPQLVLYPTTVYIVD